MDMLFKWLAHFMKSLQADYLIRSFFKAYLVSSTEENFEKIAWVCSELLKGGQNL